MSTTRRTAGGIGGAALVAAVIACAAPPAVGQSAWSAPATLAPGSPAVDRSTPVVAIGGADTAVAWTDRRRGGPPVLRIRERPGSVGAWTRSPRIVLPAAAGDPTAVAVNGRGDVVVLLRPREEPGPLLAASRRGARGPWRVRAVARLSFAASVHLALDAAGRSTVAWVSHRPERPFSVRVARGAAGGPAWRISRDVLLVAQNPVRTTVSSPSVVLNARGQVLVGWRAAGEGGQRIMSALRPPSGPWRSPEVVRDGEPGGFTPTVALSPGGSRAVAWTGPPGALTPLWSVVRPREADAWPGAVTPGASDGGQVRVALGDGGDAVVAWISGAETTLKVDVRVVARRPDGSWDPPSSLYSRDTSGSPIFVGLRGVGVGRDGTAFVVFEERERALTAETFAAVARRGVDRWAVERIAERAGGVTAFGDDGSAAAAWGFSTLPITVRTHPAAEGGGPAASDG